MSFDDMLNGFTNLIYNGCFPSRVHDQLSGELMKASYRFDEALDVVNSTLIRMSNYQEALFLKAQILYEGFADDAASEPAERNCGIEETSADKRQEIGQCSATQQ